MSASFIPTAHELVKSAINGEPAQRTSHVDGWIGSRVRRKRTSRGISQQEFSKLLEIDRDALAAFEAGAERINANLLFRIAKVLDVGPNYFFRGYVEESPDAV